MRRSHFQQSFEKPLQFFLRRQLKKSGVGNQHQGLVVLGGGFSEKNHLTTSSIARTRIAVMLYEEWRCPILFSGGRTHQPSTQSEAEGMRNLAIQLGVSKEDLFLEEKSRNTWENAKFSVPFLCKKKIHNVMLITSPQHNLRAWLSFAGFGCHAMVYEGPFPQELVSTRIILLEYGALLKNCWRFLG